MDYGNQIFVMCFRHNAPIPCSSSSLSLSLCVIARGQLWNVPNNQVTNLRRDESNENRNIFKLVSFDKFTCHIISSVPKIGMCTMFDFNDIYSMGRCL